VALALAVLAAGAGRCRATGLQLEVLNSTAAAGGTGSFDVVLANTNGPSGPSFLVSGFSVELGVSSASGVKFTSADTNTTAAAYIFGTLQQAPFSFNTFPNADFIASDASVTSPYAVSVDPGKTVGIEHVVYSVAPGTAAGQVPVTLVLSNGTTSLNDVDGNPLAFTAANGIITVTGVVVPEPSTLVLLGMAGATLAAWRGRRRRATA
jgi:hypothetical protein